MSAADTGGGAGNAAGLLYQATRWAYQLAGSPPVLDATQLFIDLFTAPSTPSGRSIVEVAVEGFRNRGIIPPAPTVQQPPAPPPAPPPPTGAIVPGAIPFPSVVDALPRVPPFITSDVAAFLRAGVAGMIAAALFYPTEAGRGSDLYRRGPGGVLAVPRPAATPGGRTRGRRGRRVRPRPRGVAVPKPRTGTPKTISRTVVRAPAQVIEDIQLGRGVEPPLAAPSQAPTSSPAAIPAPRYNTTTRTSAIPGTSPWPTSAPAPATPAATSPWARIGQYVAPFLPLAFPPGTAPRVNVPPMPSIGPSPAPQPALNPLTQFQTAAVPYAVPQTRTKECSCAKTKRKPRECTNPIVRKRKTERDGKTFITTTREQKCPASSRKKLR